MLSWWTAELAGLFLLFVILCGGASSRPVEGWIDAMRFALMPDYSALALAERASLVFFAPRAVDVPVSRGRAELHRFGFLPMPAPRAADDSGGVLLHAAFIFKGLRVGFLCGFDPFPSD